LKLKLLIVRHPSQLAEGGGATLTA